MIGYKSIKQRLVFCILPFLPFIALGQKTNSAEQSRMDTIRLDEVVVLSKATRSKGVSETTITTRIGSKELERSLGLQLADVLEKTSGVSSIKTGTTVGKPVIHGMYGKRIVLLSNGLKQTGQEWSVDHAPEVDMNMASSITVVKGADAVRYGSNAIGGIVYMEQKPLPFYRKGISGKSALSFASNGQKYNVLAMLEGQLPYSSHFAWRLQGNYENGGDRKTAHYLLNNTGTRLASCSASFGWKYHKLKLIASYDFFYNKLGTMFSAKMGSKDILQERIALGQPQYITAFSREIAFPYQKVQHHTFLLKALYWNTVFGGIEWKTGFQRDQREEYTLRRMNLSEVPSVALRLSSLQHSLSYRKSWGSWKGDFGAQYLYLNNYNRKGTGVQAILPNYLETQLGVYAIGKYKFSNAMLELALRYDYQKTKASGYDSYSNRYGGEKRFQNLSYNLGGYYNISSWLKLSSFYSRSWRAPHVFELYSNGNELAAGRFVKGDSLMHSENSHKWLLALELDTEKVSVNLSGYLQWIKGYIYDAPMHQESFTISGVYPIFQYFQTNAFFRGVDLELSYRPFRWLSYQCVASQIWANEMKTKAYLPYIPSFRLNQTLSLNYKSRLEFSLAHRFVAKQCYFNPETDLIAYTPEAYNLFALGLSYKQTLGKGKSLQLNLSAENLFNKEYKEYTNRSRYYAHDMGRDIRVLLQFNF